MSAGAEKGRAKTARIPVKIVPQERLRKPDWIRVKAGSGSTRFDEIKQRLRENKLHTVCEEASCPNIGECFGKGTATFMILGDLCTRRGAPVSHVAERAAPRAQIAQDHEGRGALAEALADIGARGFLAYGVQPGLAQEVLDFVEARAVGARLDPDPCGFLQALLRHDLDRDARRLGAAFF